MLLKPLVVKEIREHAGTVVVWVVLAYLGLAWLWVSSVYAGTDFGVDAPQYAILAASALLVAAGHLGFATFAPGGARNADRYLSVVPLSKPRLFAVKVGVSYAMLWSTNVAMLAWIEICLATGSAPLDQSLPVEIGWPFVAWLVGIQALIFASCVFVSAQAEPGLEAADLGSGPFFLFLAGLVATAICDAREIIKILPGWTPVLLAAAYAALPHRKRTPLGSVARRVAGILAVGCVLTYLALHAVLALESRRTGALRYLEVATHPSGVALTSRPDMVFASKGRRVHVWDGTSLSRCFAADYLVNPIWSPDGGGVVAEDRRNHWGGAALHTMDTVVLDGDGSLLLRLDRGRLWNPMWNPGGTRVASMYERGVSTDPECRKDRCLVVIDQTGGLRRVTTRATTGDGQVCDLVGWADDQTLLVELWHRPGNDGPCVAEYSLAGERKAEFPLPRARCYTWLPRRLSTGEYVVRVESLEAGYALYGWSRSGYRRLAAWGGRAEVRDSVHGWAFRRVQQEQMPRRTSWCVLARTHRVSLRPLRRALVDQTGNLRSRRHVSLGGRPRSPSDLVGLGPGLRVRGRGRGPAGRCL